MPKTTFHNHKKEVMEQPIVIDRLVLVDIINDLDNDCGASTRARLSNALNSSLSAEDVFNAARIRKSGKLWDDISVQEYATYSDFISSLKPQTDGE